MISPPKLVIFTYKKNDKYAFLSDFKTLSLPTRLDENRYTNENQ